MASGTQGRLEPGARLGSYTITRVLGEGGMGIVYEGLHEGLGKRVAIKTLHGGAGYSEEAAARFVREGKAAARIQHRNVVDVADVGVQDGMPYLVMEYLEGQDLGEMMEHQAPLQATAVADLMIPILSALGAVHAAQIVHRDLKPDNIFVTRGRGGQQIPKLVDFGISKLRDEVSHNLTGTNALLGTPYYMSPEQVGSSRDVDHRSDIFSLGVILYQCVTHDLPFDGDSLYQLIGKILNAEPPKVRSLAGEVPVAFEAIIERAMEKAPENRFQNVIEMGAALLPFASERVRLNHQDEFGAAALDATELAATPAPGSAPGPGGDPLGTSLDPVTTLGGMRLPRRPVLVWVLPLGALLLITLAYLVLRGDAPPVAETGADHVVEPARDGHAASPESAATAQPLAAPGPQAAPRPVVPAGSVAAADAGVQARPRPSTTTPAIKTARPRKARKLDRRRPRKRRTTGAAPAPTPAAAPLAPEAPARRDAPVDLFRDRK